MRKSKQTAIIVYRKRGTTPQTHKAMTTYTITDKQAQSLYNQFSTFRGGLRSTPRSKATAFDADRVREEFAAMHPQRQDEFARAVGAKPIISAER